MNGIECLQSKCEIDNDYEACCVKHKCIGLYNYYRKNKSAQR